MSAESEIIPADAQSIGQGFPNLRHSVPPCSGLTGSNWMAIHAEGFDFFGKWAEQAVALGCTTLDLGGVHPQVGTVQVDYCGAIGMSNAIVTDVTARHIK